MGTLQGLGSARIRRAAARFVAQDSGVKEIKHSYTVARRAA
jgi:hypothetical protein